MVTKPTIAMIGADMNAKGGVASVIRLYEEAGLFNKRVKFLASYTDGSPVQKVTFFIRFLINYIALLVNQPSIQVIHIHTSSYGSFFRKSLVVLLAKLFNKKPIIHLHGAGFNVFYNNMPFPIKWYITTVLRSCVALISLSQQWKQDLFKISRHPDIRVIYNPTVLREPVFNQQAMPQVEEAVNFLFMGRLGQRKGVYDIVESAKQIQADNVKINLYGDGEIESIQKMVSQGGLTHKIAVQGWIEGTQKEEVFRQANVLLLPSYHEGLPISILEAMAYGLPVVASDVGGISEAVQDGVNGYLIQPGDCDELANRIEQLATSSELRQKMGQSGYKLASGKFSLPVIIRQLEELYAEFTR